MHIYDNEFSKTTLPMTKQEIRAISIAKLMLKDDDILIDVGAGTGTIGIESATYLNRGKVYAIEKEEKGIENILNNVRKFNLNNYELIHGTAPQDIPDINYDAMFIGGSSGNLKEIIEHFHKYAKSGARLVINAITLETQFSALEILKNMGYKDIEIVNVFVSRSKTVGPYSMMYGENPIFILKVIKKI